MPNKKPKAKVVIPVVIAVFLVLASFVAITYIAPEFAQPHYNIVLALLFSVFATAAAIIAIYESRLRFNVRPDPV